MIGHMGNVFNGFDHEGNLKTYLFYGAPYNTILRLALLLPVRTVAL